MLYINTTTLETGDADFIRRAFPHVSFPHEIPPELLPEGCAVLRQAERPTTTAGQVASLKEPTQDATGVWVQEWEVKDAAIETVPEGLEEKRQKALEALDYLYSSALDEYPAKVGAARWKVSDGELGRMAVLLQAATLVPASYQPPAQAVMDEIPLEPDISLPDDEKVTVPDATEQRATAYNAWHETVTVRKSDAGNWAKAVNDTRTGLDAQYADMKAALDAATLETIDAVAITFQDPATR